jgi:hypothetical protein
VMRGGVARLIVQEPRQSTSPDGPVEGGPRAGRGTLPAGSDRLARRE